jgi:hypothetical protein
MPPIMTLVLFYEIRGFAPLKKNIKTKIPIFLFQDSFLGKSY